MVSHNQNTQRDFDDLETLGLAPDLLNQVKQARIEARRIISHLEPTHIYSWTGLIQILEDALKTAKRNQQQEIDEFLRRVGG